jgi:transposase
VTKHQEKMERIALVKVYLMHHLGATAKDVAHDLNLKYSTACDYVEKIRSEWRGKPKEK